MNKKVNSIIAIFLVFIMVTSSILGQVSVIRYETKKSVKDDTPIEEIVGQAMELSEFWSDEYIDRELLNNIESTAKLSVSINNRTEQEIADIALSETVTKVYNDLTLDDKEVLNEMAQDNEEIKSLLSLMKGENLSESNVSNVATRKLSNVNAIQQTADILRVAGLSSAAIATIKGAFTTMITAIKLFFTPTVIKIAIAVAAILVITAVVVYNWKIVQPFFQDIADVFIGAAGAIGNSIRNVFDQVFAKANEFTRKLGVAASIVASLAIPKLFDKIYYISYLSGNNLFINYAYALNYAEAYSVLVAAGIINVVSIAKFAVITLSTNLKNFATNLKNKNINPRIAGIYTKREMDAAKLAYALGGYSNNGKTMINEIHDYRTGSGYYRHYHDVSHTIHVWYGTPA